MEYTKAKLRLQLRIEAIKELKIPNINKEVHEQANLAQENLIDALYEAIELSLEMESPDNTQYLQGLNEALGSEFDIRSWMNDHEKLSMACEKLSQFITQKHKPDDSSALMMRLRAIAAIITHSMCFLFIASFLAIMLFAMIMMPVLPAVFVVVNLIIAIVLVSALEKLFTNDLGFTESDSLINILINGEYEKDHVNQSLINNLGLFANTQALNTIIDTPPPTSNIVFSEHFDPLSTLEPVYQANLASY